MNDAKKEKPPVVTAVQPIDGGMNIAEATRLAVPKYMRRKSWTKGRYIYWSIPNDPAYDDGEGGLHNENDCAYALTADDVAATDWEVYTEIPSKKDR